MQNRQEIKLKIALYETRKNGLSHNCDTFIEVKNLRIHKNEYIADIVFQEEDYAEIYNNCKYKKEDIDNIK